MNDALALQQENAQPPAVLGFQDSRSFEHMQRVAKAFSMSDLVPERFRNVANCVIALDLASRMKVSPLALMQSLYVVGAEPGWKATFIIAAINSCGKFSPLHFEVSGEGDDLGCIAWATELATGERLESPRVSVKMAKAEGWYSRKGSKWQTMTEVMLRYRAATLFGRFNVPEILSGLKTADELEDIGPRMKRANAHKIERPHFERDSAEQTMPDQPEPVSALERLYEQLGTDLRRGQFLQGLKLIQFPEVPADAELISQLSEETCQKILDRGIDELDLEIQEAISRPE